MLKQILTFSVAFLLCACATGPLKRPQAEASVHKKVNFFAAGHSQAAFKTVGTLNEAGLEGVLVVKKIGEDDYEVTVMTGGAYRVLQATVTPQGIAYRYLFPEVNTALVRGRISQFLNVLLLDPGLYQRKRVQDDQVILSYKGTDATVRFFYNRAEEYPFAAKTSTLLNTADLLYREFAPADADGQMLVPHELVYKDGKIELTLTLISLK